MKKTLQECKEIVAKENDFYLNPDYRGFELKLLQVTDLANKMYYEQSEDEAVRVALENQKEEIRQWLIGEDFEGLAERL